MSKISQREARRLRKKVEQMERDEAIDAAIEAEGTTLPTEKAL